MPAAQKTERPAIIFPGKIPERREVAGWIVFAALIVATCAWILSLPLFPSQDGAVHAYYAHVSRELLLGHPGFAHDFRVARPFPPYSLHAYLLMALLPWVSPELAEKLLACVCVIVGATGLAYLARQLGRSASVVAMLAVPFLLNRWIFLGFYGYAIGVGLALLAIGMWIRPQRRTLRFRAAFLLLTVVTLYTHPIAYLMVVAFCWTEVLAGWWNAKRAPLITGEITVARRDDIITVIAASALFLYILRYSHSGELWNYELLADVREKLFRVIDVFRTGYELPLHVPLYNWVLGAVLMLAMIAACWKALAEARSGKITRVQLVVAWAFLILIALPFLPRTMNGSGFFADRFSIWPPLLWFAAAASVELTRRAQKMLTVAAVALAVFTLFVVNTHIAPVARQLDLAHAPQFGWKGVHVFTRSNSRATRDLTFDPYEWAAVRAVEREDAILVDSPWMWVQILMIEETGPKVKWDADEGLRITDGPAAKITMVFTRCGDVRGESMADRLLRKHPQQFRMRKYGCLEVLEPLP